MAQKYKVGQLSDFKEGTKKRVLIPKNVQTEGAEKIEMEPLMMCMVKGKIYATSDICTHMNSSLTAGKLCEYQIECAWHGARFDIRTGEVKALPAAVPVKIYKVLVEGEDVFLELD